MHEKIYRCININNVINQLQLKKTCIKGNYIYAKCPFCQTMQETNGYLKANTLKNVFICRNCETSGSSIELYAKTKLISTKEAFKRLLKEKPVLEDIPYMYNNSIKDEFYRDLVYRNFLELQNLNNIHITKLRNMGFNDKYIEENIFKSIENNTNRKKEICIKLQKQGLKLNGIPRVLSRYRF